MRLLGVQSSCTSTWFDVLNDAAEGHAMFNLVSEGESNLVERVSHFDALRYGPNDEISSWLSFHSIMSLGTGGDAGHAWNNTISCTVIQMSLRS